MADKDAAKAFALEWQGRGDEKQDTQTFWISLLQRVFGVGKDNIAKVITFEVRTSKKKKGKDFKDAVLYRYDRDKEVLIEQKSFGIPLGKPIKQSDGEMLTPFEQAKRYDDQSIVTDKARWIIICNFGEFWIYDMTLDGAALNEPVKKVALADLPSNLNAFAMLEAGNKETTPNFNEEIAVSVKAGDLVGRMYDAFEEQYVHDENGQLSDAQRQALNKLCVRLVFCLYAEDSGLFYDKQFHDYMEGYPTARMRRALIDLFNTLNTPVDKRDPYLEQDVAAFPYVNGGLFAGEIEIPNFTDEIRSVLLDEESELFDWSAISPTIFGAVFESTLNPETRRGGGMHYTSIENIHRVIDPLFLNDLKAECDRLLSNASTTETQLKAFQNKLASMTFLDPACGSGNFLTETYLSLRRIENKIIQAYTHLMQMGDIINPIKVSIQQFYGIEINDFAVSVGQTALWIAEHKMFKETEKILFMSIDFLPLKTFTHIHEGNALRMNWNDVIPVDHLNYIIGNPPFVSKTGRVAKENSSSKRMLNNDQRLDKEALLGANSGVLDYVCCWFKKSAEFIKHSKVKASLVATNSICEGQQVALIWSQLLALGISINYCYQSFKWSSETANNKGATVYVVIVGFSYNRKDKCKIYADNGKVTTVKHINPYLFEGPDILIKTRNTPLCNVPPIGMGNQPIDNGLYIFDYDGMCQFVTEEPNAKQYFHEWFGSEDFIKRKPRYILWLGDCSPAQIRAMPKCYEIVKKVREYRLKSNRSSTKRLADRPTHFQTENMPTGSYIVIPEVSSGNRAYIPIGFMDGKSLCSNKVRLMPDANLFHFGILESKVHMAWANLIGGHYGPSFQYSVNIIYNNFPWPQNLTNEKMQTIEKTGKAILDARALYPDSSLADLYDPLTMPIELRKAHDSNDKAVMDAYGFKRSMTETEIVSELMKMYQALVDAERTA